MKNIFILLSFFILIGCSSNYAIKNKSELVCIQIVDRNGLNETIATKERLERYKQTDFFESHPYKQVIRIYDSGNDKKTSKITTYHPNGLVFQYLEIVNARAFGMYKQWHENGSLAIEASIIGGPAGVSSLDQSQWIFDGLSKAWDDKESLLSIFNYEKGLLEGNCYYFHENGKIKKEQPYHKNEIEGVVIEYDPLGRIIAKTSYKNGKKHGKSLGFFNNNSLSFEEFFKHDSLQEAKYFDEAGNLLSEINNGNGKKIEQIDSFQTQTIEYKEGQADGCIKVFKNNLLQKIYHVKNNKKHGEEIEFYHDGETAKISLNWSEDKIQGTVKTWFKNGLAQSQKEIHNNKKNGVSTTWYNNGSLMYMEEYENDVLTKGSYYKRNENIPISTILKGNGTATLYDENGIFLQTIKYVKGQPELDDQ